MDAKIALRTKEREKEQKEEAKVEDETGTISEAAESVVSDVSDIDPEEVTEIVKAKAALAALKEKLANEIEEEKKLTPEEEEISENLGRFIKYNKNL